MFLRYVLLILAMASMPAWPAESVCYGMTKNGRLENGVQLPSEGKNFVSYGSIPRFAGRTYVHSKARDVIVDAYKMLEAEHPDKVFKYAETGFKEGGRFKPHKTHQNGLSVDFMVPVTDEKGHSVHLPTHALNKYGYAIEFDTKSRYGHYRIDYEALAAHLVALHKSAAQHGIGIWRVIFDPKLVSNLYKTAYGNYINKHIEIPDKESWVRHDEHYHVDFDVKCKPM